jgi:outer membrane protein OmpA-like peptidoglycan-associated protein/uncharacterized protein YidB (DUF937 family)
MQALLDVLIPETSQKFGLGDKAGALAKAVLTYIFDEVHGGMAGFVQRFRDLGLGDIIESWISRGENKPISESQVVEALGGEPLNRISELSGLSQQTVVPALAHLLPKLVDLLTPDGLVPALAPAAVTALIGRQREVSLAPAAFDAEGVELTKKNSWFVPSMLAALLLVTGLILANVKGAAKGPTKLTVRNNGSVVEYFGLVGDMATKEAIEKALRDTFDADKLRGSLGLDETAAKPAWLAKAAEFFGLFQVPGSELDVDGNTIRVTGFFSDAEKAQLIEKVKALLPGLNVTAGGDKVAESVKAAFDRSMAALTALPAGFTSTQLVEALNLSIINFASGSADIPEDAAPLILKASDALKSAPSGTRIEIGGHTDSTGDEAANLKLSEARAAAVKRALEAKGVPPGMLVAKGYGSSQPRATNENEFGRFQNRRIEYKAL